MSGVHCDVPAPVTAAAAGFLEDDVDCCEVCAIPAGLLAAGQPFPGAGSVM
jgi:hypothetical protein